jgi:hypothetical protein
MLIDLLASVRTLLLYNVNNKMAPASNIFLVFGLMTIANGSLELGILNVVQSSYTYTEILYEILFINQKLQTQ